MKRTTTTLGGVEVSELTMQLAYRKVKHLQEWSAFKAAVAVAEKHPHTAEHPKKFTAGIAVVNGSPCSFYSLGDFTVLQYAPQKKSGFLARILFWLLRD
jgi:hypothetical protein